MNSIIIFYSLFVYLYKQIKSSKAINFRFNKCFINIELMDKKQAILLTSVAIAGGVAVAMYFIKKRERRKKIAIHFI